MNLIMVSPHFGLLSTTVLMLFCLQLNFTVRIIEYYACSIRKGRVSTMKHVVV